MHKVIVVLMVLVAVVYSRPDDEKYTTKYDGIDLDQILTNDRLLNQYLKCLTSEGTCTPDGQELKDNLEDALQHECSKCNENQRAGAIKVIKYLLEKKPDKFKGLEAIYDKDGIYRKKYEEEAKKEGIKL